MSTAILIATAVIELAICFAFESASYRNSTFDSAKVTAEQLKTEQIAQDAIRNAGKTAHENMFN